MQHKKHSSRCAPTLITSYSRDRLKEGGRQLRKQNKVFFPRKNKQVKLPLKVPYDITQWTLISQPTILFQEWDVQIFGQSPDMNFICQHTTLTESLSRFLFLPLKSKVFQPETASLAHYQLFFTPVRLPHVECFVIKQNSLPKFMLCWEILLRKLEVNNEIFWAASQQPQHSWQEKEGCERLGSSYRAVLCQGIKAFRKKKSCKSYSYLL